MTRRTDPRLANVIWKALGDARTVVNVGAGSGAYEPADRDVVAVEPSAVMIAQRPPEAAPVVRAQAEALPFADGSFDGAMAVLSDHHWHDRRQGLRELRRVARRRVVLFNADPALADRFWLTTEYLPEFLKLIADRYRAPGAWQRELEDALGPVRLVPAPIPHDCADGFYGAFRSSVNSSIGLAYFSSRSSSSERGAARASAAAAALGRERVTGHRLARIGPASERASHKSGL